MAISFFSWLNIMSIRFNIIAEEAIRNIKVSQKFLLESVPIRRGFNNRECLAYIEMFLNKNLGSL